MPVIDELPRGEDGGDEFHAVDDGVEAALQQLDQPLAGVAAAARRLLVEAAKLALADIAVIALELLLRHPLRAEVGGLLAPLPVLPRPLVAPVPGALRPAPETDAGAPACLVFRPCSLAPRPLSRLVFVF